MWFKIATQAFRMIRTNATPSSDQRLAANNRPPACSPAHFKCKPSLPPTAHNAQMHNLLYFYFDSRKVQVCERQQCASCWRTRSKAFNVTVVGSCRVDSGGAAARCHNLCGCWCATPTFFTIVQLSSTQSHLFIASTRAHVKFQLKALHRCLELQKRVHFPLLLRYFCHMLDRNIYIYVQFCVR